MARSSKGKKLAGKAAKATWVAFLRRQQRIGKRNALRKLMRSRYGVSRKTAKLHVRAGTTPSAEEMNNGTRSGNFMGQHHKVAWSVDMISELIYRLLDKRELAQGKMTDSEYDAYQQDPAAIEKWRKEMAWRRREARARQRDSRPPGVWSPVSDTWVITAPPPEPAPAFTPPPRRRPIDRGPLPKPTTTTPRPRTRRPKKVSRPAHLRRVWGTEFQKIKENAMAEPNLAAAVAAMRGFAESQPTDRGELHAHLAAFAAFGDEIASMTETFKANLERPLPDGTPGVPSEVTSRLAPVADAGEEIARAAQDCANAFEDRFAEAIRVAQDEEKMSDEYLKEQPA